MIDEQIIDVPNTCRHISSHSVSQYPRGNFYYNQFTIDTEETFAALMHSILLQTNPTSVDVYCAVTDVLADSRKEIEVCNQRRFALHKCEQGAGCQELDGRDDCRLFHCNQIAMYRDNGDKSCATETPEHLPSSKLATCTSSESQTTNRPSQP